MKKYIPFTVFFLLLAVAPLHALPLPDGLQSAINEISVIAQTVKNFSLLLYSIVAFFTKLVGFKAILLFIATLLTASGLVSVGVPAGRRAFIVALLFWDTLWVLWRQSAGTLDFTAGLVIAETSIKVIIPFAIFDLIRLTYRWASVRIVRAFNKKNTTTDRMLSVAEEFIAASAGLQGLILRDIKGSGKKVVLSKETISAARILRDKCSDLVGGTGIGSDDGDKESSQGSNDRSESEKNQ